jgi:prophage maintenance system killer protein
MKQKKLDELIIFKGKNGQVKLRGDFRNDTMWVTQAQMSEVFGVDLRTVNEHLQNIYKTGELTTDATLRKFRIVQTEGKREVEREVNHYDLDTVISVGYRVNSKTATQFRQWATQTLRQHITQGFTINRAQLAHNYDAFMEAVAATRSLLPAVSEMEPGAVLELVQLFADTWFSLDAYDKEQLTPKKVSKKRVKLTSAELHAGIAVLKTELMKKGQASENFAQERNLESVEGIVGNVMQEFGGKAVYLTVEEKAAHLLYFIIKNHPFVDGNKRSGAYAFVWFLQKARVLNTNQLTPSALTALTLLIAQSDPKDKEQMTKLVVLLITQRSK